ncbi:MAG: YczE/YyaS/YitT family protein [Anaerovoracaceae bacterium]|jgi:uncharacterized membrane protein YczE
MSRNELIKRYVIFLIGLAFTSFGIALVTKASLGTSPMTSIPYALSLIIPRLSIGHWTVLFSLFLILLQLVMLRKEANKIEILLQVVIAFAFGYLIDVAMFFLRSFFPVAYGIKIASLILGSFIVAIGVSLQLIANVVMVPADAFVRTITIVSKKKYGNIRVCSDMSMALTGAILCLVFLGELTGVREGTIIAAICVGNMVKLIRKSIDILQARITLRSEKLENDEREQITIMQRNSAEESQTA